MTADDMRALIARVEAVRLAAAGLLKSLPTITTGKAGRILAAWRRELAETTGGADA